MQKFNQIDVLILTALLMCEIRKIFPYELLRGGKIPGYVIAESRLLK
jgi:hypothetical protein